MKSSQKVREVVEQIAQGVRGLTGDMKYKGLILGERSCKNHKNAD